MVFSSQMVPACQCCFLLLLGSPVCPAGGKGGEKVRSHLQRRAGHRDAGPQKVVKSPLFPLQPP